MKLRIFTLILISIFNLIISSSMPLYVPHFTVLPNCMLIIIVCYAILRDDVEGTLFGFFNGLLFDIFFGRVIGFYAFLGLITGFLSAKPFKEFNSNNVFTPTVIIFTVSMFYESVFYFFSFLFRGRTDYFFYLTNIILPEAILNLLFGIPIYFILYLINSKLEEHEKPKRKMFSSVGGNNGKI